MSNECKICKRPIGDGETLCSVCAADNSSENRIPPEEIPGSPAAPQVRPISPEEAVPAAEEPVGDFSGNAGDAPADVPADNSSLPEVADGEILPEAGREVSGPNEGSSLSGEEEIPADAAGKRAAPSRRKNAMRAAEEQRVTEAEQASAEAEKESSEAENGSEEHDASAPASPELEREAPRPEKNAEEEAADRKPVAGPAFPGKKKHPVFRLAELAANPYLALKKKPGSLLLVLSFPALTYLLAFLHIAWDKIVLSYLPAGFVVLYLAAGLCAGLVFTAADAGLTLGISYFCRTGRKDPLWNLAGALALPSVFTLPLAVAGLFFRLIAGWGSIVFVPVELLLPLCFLLPFWMRYSKGRQLPAIVAVFCSGLFRLGIAHIFLNMKF